MNPPRLIKNILLIILIGATCTKATAQLSADFTIDKAGGCSPLTVKFTNATTGASPNATYKWDLGNGNTSGLPSPGATYTQQKVYTVILTVKDGAATSTKTQQVTVYKNPVVDFTGTPLTGCMPLNVSFNSNASSGDGTISSYFWDFGDGQTQTGSSYNQTAHTYTFAQTAGVSLTVTNSYGCYSTASKSGYVAVSPPVTALLSANQTTLCQTNNQVSFTNNSTGPGTLTYKWNFGDGQTSTSTAPTHTYTTKGTYTVTLDVSSSLGCTNSVTMTNYINVANFNVDFTVPTQICAGKSVVLTDVSTLTFNSILWQTDGLGTYNYATYDNNYSFYFNDTVNHSIQLTHTYGNCTVSKTKTIKASPSPVLTGFVATIKGGACTPPITVNFSDTANDGGVKWQWLDAFSSTLLATGKQASYSFNSQTLNDIQLTVTNSSGCAATISQYLDLQKPNINILSLNTANNYSNSGCPGAIFKFSATPDTVIKSYQWNFGDGDTSTLRVPLHAFAKTGNYTITLNYITKAGCAGMATYYYVGIVDKPNPAFTILPDTVCGNSIVNFQAAQNQYGWSYFWNYGDNSLSWSSTQNVTHQYYYDSVYTVTLIVQNNLNGGGEGGCADTSIQTITVKPDFPKISWQTNTCDGTRGMVTFGQASTKVNKYIWDFGDGTSKVTYNTEVDTVYHTYTKTGSFKVVLTGINGACSVNDSTTAYVLLKQSPKLSSPQSSACGSDNVSITVNNMEANPAPYYNNIYYYVNGLQYGDLTPAPFPVYGYQYNATTYSSTITGLNPGESQLRFITQSTYFNCYDTSNFIPLKIHGPTAGFDFLKNYVCFKSPVVLKDSSVAGANVPIKTWLWSFGDGLTQTVSKSENISHVYANPGQYTVSLTVTDTAGCTNTTPYYYAGSAVVSGPQASFTVSQNPVPPNTTVYFYNNTNTYNAYDVTYTWLFPDGSKSQNFDPSYLFTTAGADTVKLISANNQLTCVDTALKVIYVRKVNTAFTYTFSYINNKNCPPVIVTFTSTTSNANGIYWDFGDGSQGGNQSIVSHTYTNPGVYQVVLYGFDANNNLDSTVDYITVKGPYAILAADKLTGCDSLTVVLSATIKNATSFTWDFGDGTLQTTTDTFSLHQYIIPGIYTPQLILKDGGGCAGTSALANKIIVDTLSAAIAKTPAIICDSAIVYFTPTVTSIAQDQLQLPLQYHWDFGTGTAQDTSSQVTTFFKYHKTGGYGVNLTVSSAFGCVQTVTDSIVVQPVSKAGISGPSDICENTIATFTGTAANYTNSLGWNWQFYGNNKVAQVQGPVTATYNDSGTYTVTLIVNNNGCYDTAYSPLHVHGTPLLNILPKLPKVCLGGSVQLTAHDAQTFLWSPGVKISDTSSATPFVSPVNATWYHVRATNVYGCVTNDSVLVTVDLPFKLKTDSVLNICIGNSGQFNVTGADIYKWISGTGLSNTQIPNPMVKTTIGQKYIVVGYDKDGCFTDTAAIQVVVMARPSITVMPHSVTINAGMDIQLYTNASADVLQYAWKPVDYLSCANCPSPLSSPKLPTVYIVTVTNQYGCIASDTAKVELLCAKDLIYIPNAFTPNNDNANDRFVIKGTGVRLIKHIVIFGRLGDKMFERSNIGTDDSGNSWDGLLNGIPQPPGVYVYMAQIMCATGEVYDFKGTITLVR